jgi:hypothetical protein
VLQKETASFIEPGVMVGWGNGPLGLQLEFRPSLSTHPDETPNAIQAGAAVSLDFGNEDFADVPVALAIEYNFDKDVDGSDPEHLLTSGLFYSAKRDLQLGFRFSKIVGKPGSVLHFGTLNLGYFF